MAFPFLVGGLLVGFVSFALRAMRSHSWAGYRCAMFWLVFSIAALSLGCAGNSLAARFPQARIRYVCVLPEALEPESHGNELADWLPSIQSP